MGTEAFQTAAGAMAWRYQTSACANPPNARLLAPGGGRGPARSTALSDDGFLATPFLRLQPYDAKFPARLTSLKFKHRVELRRIPGHQQRPRRSSQGDLFELLTRTSSSCRPLYDSTDNSGSFVQEDLDLTTGSAPRASTCPTAGSSSSGWFQADAANRTRSCSPCRSGWYIDDVEIHYEVPAEIADTSTPPGPARRPSR